jgi:hypothetical protein
MCVEIKESLGRRTVVEKEFVAMRMAATTSVFIIRGHGDVHCFHTISWREDIKLIGAEYVQGLIYSRRN